MKTLPFILLAFAALMLSGCLAYDNWMGKRTATGELAATPAAAQAPSDSTNEKWCYHTLGYADCYATPQSTNAGRLINVNPQARFPANQAAYNKAVNDAQTPDSAPQ